MPYWEQRSGTVFLLLMDLSKVQMGFVNRQEVHANMNQ